MSHNIKFKKNTGEEGIRTIQHIYNDAEKSNIEFQSNGDIAFNTQSASNAMYVKNNGYVGIGTSNPQYKLHVNGEAKINNLTVTSVTTTSDRRLKVNIKDLEKYEIEGVHPVQYNWKKNRSGPMCYGFIAQEIEKIYPNMIKRNKRGLYSVDYIQMIPVSVKNIQLQEKKIRELEARIIKLEGGEI